MKLFTYKWCEEVGGRVIVKVGVLVGRNVVVFNADRVGLERYNVFRLAWFSCTNEQVTVGGRGRSDRHRRL